MPAKKKNGMARSFASAPGSLLTNWVPTRTRGVIQNVEFRIAQNILKMM
jgi:hypothetical protein